MCATISELSVYPADAFQVLTVLCIGAEDQISDGNEINTEVIVHRHHGCATYRVITSILIDQNIANLPSALIASQLEFCEQIAIGSIKIGFLGSLEIVEEVESFLQHSISQKCPIVFNLNSAYQWKDDVLEAAIRLLLPFCSILIITYDVVLRLCMNQKQSIKDVLNILLKAGLKAVVVQYENGQRSVAFNDEHDIERLEIENLQVPDHRPPTSAAEFSAATVAHLAHDNLSLRRIIFHSHSYSTVKQYIHLPFLHVPTLSFTQELWSSVNGIYSRMLNLPFLKEMLDSTLDQRIYDYYIIQDYYFFLDRRHMLHGLIRHCTNNDEICQFFNIQLEKNEKFVKTLLEDNNLSPCDENTIRKMPACLMYTKFMRELGHGRGNFSSIKGLVGLLPCTLVYAKIGDWMIASGMQPKIKRYADFIDTYRDQGRRDRLICFLELVNRIADTCSYEQRQKLKHLFHKVCGYEYAFWNDAYQYGIEYRNDLMGKNLERSENDILQVNDFELSD